MINLIFFHDLVDEEKAMDIVYLNLDNVFNNCFLQHCPRDTGCSWFGQVHCPFAGLKLAGWPGPERVMSSWWQSLEGLPRLSDRTSPV